MTPQGKLQQTFHLGLASLLPLACASSWLCGFWGTKELPLFLIIGVSFLILIWDYYYPSLYNSLAIAVLSLIQIGIWWLVEHWRKPERDLNSDALGWHVVVLPILLLYTFVGMPLFVGIRFDALRKYNKKTHTNA